MLTGRRTILFSSASYAFFAGSAAANTNRESQPPKASVTTQPVRSTTEIIEHSTVYIQTVDKQGVGHSATSFIYVFFQDSGKGYPALVTNKHVFVNQVQGFIVLTLKPELQAPPRLPYVVINISNFASHWIGHPDPNVDLGFMLLEPILRQAGHEFSDFDASFVTQTIIPTDSVLAAFDPVSDVIVVGYPAGAFDTDRNLPIFRRGITATQPSYDFQGENAFLIDCAIWPGSSGSPVFIYYNGVVPGRSGMSYGTECYFIGIVAEVLRATAEEVITPVIANGTIVAPPAKQETPEDALVLSPDGLGLCITSQVIFDFEPILIKMGINPPSNYVARQ